MLSVLLVPLLLSGVTPAAPGAASHAAAAPSDPTVRVSLDNDTYDRGDGARAKVQIRDDGYLVVLHVSPDGLVRVLFPLDPTDDNFVRGGKSYEIRGRGDRNAFTVGSTPGTGTVYAAWSGQPFHFDSFTRDGHWDYTVLGDTSIAGDPETGFTNLVGQMATGHFDYDLTSYTVPQQVAYARRDYVAFPMWTDPWAYPYYDPYYYGGFGYGGFGVGLGLVFGSPYYYSPYYYSPYSYGYGYGGYFGGCYYCGGVYYRPYAYYPGGPFRWKGGIVGGGGIGGVIYRPRTVFGPNVLAKGPVPRTARFSGPGIAAPWRTSRLTGGGILARQPVLRVNDAPGVRRMPVSVRMPNATPSRERTVFAEPARGVARPPVGTRAVPDRPRFEPSARRAEPTTRVAEPATRVNAPRVSEPRVSAPRAMPAPRNASPSMRRPEMNYEPQSRFEGTRAEPRMQAPRVEAPRAEPQFQAPRAQPRFEAPRSAPRVEAPRGRSSGGFSAPRASAPRSFGGGGGGGHHGFGGGGGRHH